MWLAAKLTAPYNRAIRCQQPLLCVGTVQVYAHHAIDQARSGLCRFAVLQTYFQFIGRVQASRAYCQRRYYNMSLCYIMSPLGLLGLQSAMGGARIFAEMK